MDRKIIERLNRGKNLLVRVKLNCAIYAYVIKNEATTTKNPFSPATTVARQRIKGIKWYCGKIAPTLKHQERIRDKSRFIKREGSERKGRSKDAGRSVCPVAFSVA